MSKARNVSFSLNDENILTSQFSDNKKKDKLKFQSIKKTIVTQQASNSYKLKLTTMF